MFGYAVNPSVGAVAYNIVHHKFTALLVLAIRLVPLHPKLTLIWDLK
ncbi:DUF4260 domain-containing protein [Sphingobacterium sp. SGR-19]|nr:DUF4260 domain-containing protein [Sphingobacterium sp. SGR-19]